MLNQDLDNLKKAIREVLDEMVKKGMIHGLKDKEALVNTIANNIAKAKPELTAKEMLQPSFIKALQVSIMAQHLMDHTKEFKFDYTKLFLINKPALLNDKNRQETEKELTNTLKMLFTLMNKHSPDPKDKLTDAKINELSTTLTKDIMKTYMSKTDQASMSQSNSIMNTLIETLAQTNSIRSIFGVAKPGEIPRPIPSVMGNLQGFSDFSGANETSNAFIDAANRFDNKPDPLGIETLVLLNDICSGFVGAQVSGEKPELQAEATNKHEPMTPFSTKLTPPNSTGKA